jgi:hypothetical protein
MANNLFSNLLVAFILLSLFVIIYCKVKNKTLLDVIREIREGLSVEENG